MANTLDRLNVGPRVGLAPCTLGLGCSLLIAGLASAGIKNWNAGSGDWSTAGNWSPIGLPGPADPVLVGNTAAAHNDWLTLDVHASIASLAVTDGMMVDCDVFRLLVAANTQVSGQNDGGDVIYPSRIRVGQSPFALDFVTNDLTVVDEAWLEIEDGATMRVNGLFTVGDGSLLWGEGNVDLYATARWR